MSEIPEPAPQDLDGAISTARRHRLAQGHFESGEDVVALRRFIGLSQARFAEAVGISVHTLRNWEQGPKATGRPGPGSSSNRGPASSDAPREPGILRLSSATRLRDRRG